MEKAIKALQDGGRVLLSTDAGRVVAVSLFHKEARAWLCGRGAEIGGKLPIILLASVEHIEALAANLSADAQVMIRRFLPGALALAVHPSPMTPEEVKIAGGLIALNVPAHPKASALIGQVGVPLVCLSYPLGPSDKQLEDAGIIVLPAEDDPSTPETQATILDVTRRPSRILRAGTPDRTKLERFILLDIMQ